MGTFICAATGQLGGSVGDDLLVMTWSNVAASVSHSCHVARSAVSSPHLLVLWDVAVGVDSIAALAAEMNARQSLKVTTKMLPSVVISCMAHDVATIHAGYHLGTTCH